MSPPKSFKTFYTWGSAFIGLLFLFFILLYQYDQQREFKEDLANGYGVPITAPVTTIDGKNNSNVTVTYYYRGYKYERLITYYDIDSMQAGTVVRLMISSLHPTNEVKYVGVDTTATLKAGIPLVQHPRKGF